ncbi:MAG: hypothetical protein IT376_14315 [Polyangiaceae bacterium]|nr:hypothetical protein [Polyangiaceae bacterium]
MSGVRATAGHVLVPTRARWLARAALSGASLLGACLPDCAADPEPAAQSDGGAAGVAGAAGPGGAGGAGGGGGGVAGTSGAGGQSGSGGGADASSGGQGGAGGAGAASAPGQSGAGGSDASADAWAGADATLDGDAASEAPHPPVCGDGWRDEATEECDDGVDSTPLLDSCSGACVVEDVPVAPVPAGDGGTAERVLGAGRHVVAGTGEGFAVTWVERGGAEPAVALRSFSGRGVPGVHLTVSEGARPAFEADPVVAALPGARHAVAWTDRDVDGDELGIALRVVTPSAAAPLGTTLAANTTTAFAQRDPDIVVASSAGAGEVVVAWADDSAALGGPDLRYRRFDATLAPIGGEQVLAATLASEGAVALAAGAAGSWAAAWRAREGAAETIVVQARSSGAPAIGWVVEAGEPGDADDVPALAPLDASRWLVVFTRGTDPEGDGVADTPRLAAAVLDRAVPGPTAAIALDPLDEPWASDEAVGQSHPAVVIAGATAYVAWRSASLAGDSLAEELWLKRLSWTPADGGVTLDLSSIEVPLPRRGPHQAGDQRRPALAAFALYPEGVPALAAAWEDWGRAFGEGAAAPEVAAQLVPLPLLRLPGGEW